MIQARIAGASEAASKSQRRIGKVSKPVHEKSPSPQMKASGLKSGLPASRWGLVSRSYQGTKRMQMISSAEAIPPKTTRG
jgi:hypothetical protein